MLKLHAGMRIQVLTTSPTPSVSAHALGFPTCCTMYLRSLALMEQSTPACHSIDACSHHAPLLQAPPHLWSVVSYVHGPLHDTPAHSPSACRYLRWLQDAQAMVRCGSRWHFRVSGLHASGRQRHQDHRRWHRPVCDLPVSARSVHVRSVIGQHLLNREM
jgi:hypothetical protein